MIKEGYASFSRSPGGDIVELVIQDVGVVVVRGLVGFVVGMHFFLLRVYHSDVRRFVGEELVEHHVDLD